MYTKFKNTFVREEGFIDKRMVGQCLANYSEFKYDENSIVLDLGANIGGYAVMALEENIKSYIGYEPDEENFKLLEMNCKFDKRAFIIKSAASMIKDDHVEFCQTSSKSAPCSGSIIPNRGRNIKYSVKNEYLPDILENYRPTHIKMDIEGAEKEWLKENKGIFPGYVKEMAIELHSRDLFELFNDVYYHNIIKDFDFVSIDPNYGFVNKKIPNAKIYKNLNINLPECALFGIDIFLRRK